MKASGCRDAGAQCDVAARREAVSPGNVLAALALVLTAGSMDGAAGQSALDVPIPAATCAADDGRTRVLLLGSYHMANPGADAFNLEADDVLAPKRQAEIEAVVHRLAGFAPTHVALEAPWGDTAIVASYRHYVAGERELRRNESEQIGFRLAKRLGHLTVYPIDVRMGMDFGTVGRVASQEPRLAGRLQEMQSLGQEVMSRMGQWLAEGTVGSMLRHMNEPDMLARGHRLYTDIFVPIVVGDDYAGADMVATWYQRNLRIFANLTRIDARPGDRVLVVYGQGHIPLLQQLVSEHSDFCVANPLPYLRGL
jgi:hypothetical protein